jgi:prophage regulatory protein
MTAQTRLIRLPELLTLVGYGRSTVYEMVDKGTFPAPVRLGPKAIAWRSDQVDAWIDSRPPVTSVTP